MACSLEHLDVQMQDVTSEVQRNLLGPADQQKSEVRRNLFGPVDHQQLQLDFQRLFSSSAAVDQERWSFDFQHDRPSPGCVQWEELRCQDVPAFYWSCVRKTVQEPSRTALKRLKMEKRSVKRKQATITDFFRVTRRRFLHQKTSSQ